MMEPESPRRVSAKAQTKESLKAALTSKVPERGQTKASLKANRTLTVSEMASTMASRMASRTSMVSGKVQMKVQPTEAESRPKVSGKAQTKETLKAALTSKTVPDFLFCYSISLTS